MTDTPWLENKAWANNQISSYSKLQFIISVVFLVIWCAICYGLYLKRDELLASASDEPALYLMGLFPLGLLAIAYQTFKQYQEWRNIGAMPLSLDPFPGSIGGHVGGSIFSRLPYTANMQAKVKLLCVKSTLQKGSHSKRRDTVEWENDGLCHVQPSANGSRLSFRFDVDDTLPPSGAVEDSKSNIIWRLQLDVDDKLHRLYDIPVFKTAEQSRHIRHSTEDYEASIHAAGEELGNIALLTRGKEQSAIYFKPFKRPLKGILLSLMGVIFAGAGIIAGKNDAPLVFVIIFPIVGFGLTLAGLQYLGKALLVSIDKEQVKTQRLYFGISFSSKVLPLASFKSFELKNSGTVTHGTKSTSYYQLFMIDKDGEEYRVAERLNGRSEANKVESTLREICNLSAE